jgi:tetratricopeptide (TPR) repeat protein
VPTIKNSLFTFIALVIVPVLFFVLLEIGLRIVNVGTSYDYFHELEINGKTYYQENPDFADQFYPASLNIGPMENTFSEERPANLVRVFVIGGSAAKGFPHKNHGVDRLLGAQLRAALPGKQIEVINLAMTSVNSHVNYAVAQSIPDNSADFAIVLMGNNEVVGPYGPGTFIENFTSSLTLIRTIQALKRTRLWQVLDKLMQDVSNPDAMQDLEWQGMQMFTNNGVSQSDPRMTSVYSHYQHNLRDIISILQDKGMHVLLSSVPVNLRHSAPFLSIHSEQLAGADAEQWQQLTTAGSRHIQNQDWQAAVQNFEAALRIDPGYADTHFQLATAYENLQQYNKAKAHYEQALNLDALRFRADTQMNAIIQDIADSIEPDNFSYVDNALAFEEASKPFQPGWNLLVEHVHYDFSGNHILAAEFSKAIMSAIGKERGYAPLSAQEVANTVGFPNDESISLYRKLKNMINKPPFTGQSNYADLEQFVSNKISSTITAVGKPEDTLARRQVVADAGRADWKLHFEMAALNQYTRNREAVLNHYQAIYNLYPHNRETMIRIAEIHSRAGNWQEAIPYLERSRYYTRGDVKKIAETMGWLGTAYYRIKEYDKGTELLEEMVRSYSDQIGLTLRAYGNLIKTSVDRDLKKDTQRYADDVQDYAQSLVKQGRDKEFPLLYKRMQQIMTLAGNKEEAIKWELKSPKSD